MKKECICMTREGMMVLNKLSTAARNVLCFLMWDSNGKRVRFDIDECCTFTGITSKNHVYRGTAELKQKGIIDSVEGKTKEYTINTDMFIFKKIQPKLR